MKTEFEKIPSHFFEKGPYEVWASKSYGSHKIVKIADGLGLETAKTFKWPYKEIRLNGKRINSEEANQ